MQNNREETTMPDSYEEWYQKQVESGKLPDENGYYHYTYSEDACHVDGHPDPRRWSADYAREQRCIP